MTEIDVIMLGSGLFFGLIVASALGSIGDWWHRRQR